MNAVLGGLIGGLIGCIILAFFEWRQRRLERRVRAERRQTIDELEEIENAFEVNRGRRLYRDAPPPGPHNHLPMRTPPGSC